MRLVLDGLDQLNPEAASDIRAGLRRLHGDPACPHVHLILGQRTAPGTGPSSGAGGPPPDGQPGGGPGGVPGGLLAEGGLVLTVEAPQETVLVRYLQRRRLPVALAVRVARECARGGGAWLLARLVGDIYPDLDQTDQQDLLTRLEPVQPGSSAGDGAAERVAVLAWLYDRQLSQLGADEPDRWGGQLRPVLTPLVAAGAGPVMPVALLAAVSAHFGGPADIPGVRAVLAQLGRLVVRYDPGTDDELVGLFHPTLTEHLGGHAAQRVDVIGGHRVLLAEIDRLAPVSGLYLDNPLSRWAAEAEAEHLWQLGEITFALKALKRRPLPTPQRNLDRWIRWHQRVHTARGPHHPQTLQCRAAVGYWTGEAGSSAQALALYRRLLPDWQRVLGPDHPDTLTTRGNIAAWTGKCGQGADALALFRKLLPDQQRVLGPASPGTLTTRSNIAFWTGETGQVAEALALFRKLLPDQQRVLGPDHPDTVGTQRQIVRLEGGLAGG